MRPTKKKIATHKDSRLVSKTFKDIKVFYATEKLHTLK